MKFELSETPTDGNQLVKIKPVLVIGVDSPNKKARTLSQLLQGSVHEHKIDHHAIDRHGNLLFFAKSMKFTDELTKDNLFFKEKKKINFNDTANNPTAFVKHLSFHCS
jgi:hypothetical protein